MYSYETKQYNLTVFLDGEKSVKFEGGTYQTEDKAIALHLEKTEGVTRHADSEDPTEEQGLSEEDLQKQKDDLAAKEKAELDEKKKLEEKQKDDKKTDTKSDKK